MHSRAAYYKRSYRKLVHVQDCYNQPNTQVLKANSVLMKLRKNDYFAFKKLQILTLFKATFTKLSMNSPIC